MAASVLVVPVRPLPLSISRTCVFKTIPETNTKIHVDIYTPNSFHTRRDEPSPVALFIHGGGWAGSNRSDYSRPLFQYFLDIGFVVASMDYRLIPESSHLEQLDDVRDVESWLRKDLPALLGDGRSKVDRKIVVIGASAGAQLALLTPKLWKESPTALLILYAPTNMHSLPYSGRGRLSVSTIPPATHELLAEATDYENPPSEKAISMCAMDYVSPRVVMSTHVFRNAIVAEILLKGLRSDQETSRDEDKSESEAAGKLRLPERGSVPEHEIDEISPLHVLLSRPHLSPTSTFIHPPTYLLTGTADEMFSPTDHTVAYHTELLRQNIISEVRLVDNEGHAFDVWAEIGSPIAEKHVKPAVQWIANVIGHVSNATSQDSVEI